MRALRPTQIMSNAQQGRFTLSLQIGLLLIALLDADTVCMPKPVA